MIAMPAISKASTASSRISSIASTRVRRSRRAPTTISRRCAWSRTRTPPPAGARAASMLEERDKMDAASHPLIGNDKAALDTPALVVDLDVLEANIARIAKTCRDNGVGWRPHTKAHKTPEIARLQLAAGAIGVACAKVGEAEAMAAAGIRDIFIVNQVVGAQKVRRVIDLVGPARLIVAVDCIANLDELSAAARAQSKTLDVVIEVDIGMHRAGVLPGAPVVALAAEIARRPGLSFVGVTGWESQATRIADPVEKQRVVAAAIGELAAS